MQVAIKFLQRGERLASVYVEREIVNHSSLLHPHIVQFKEVTSKNIKSVDCNFWPTPIAVHLTTLLLSHAGISYTGIPGNRHGICGRRGHVPVCQGQARPAGIYCHIRHGKVSLTVMPTSMIIPLAGPNNITPSEQSCVNFAVH